MTTRVLVESRADVSTLQSRDTHSVQHNVDLAAVDLIPQVQHAPLDIGAMACANGELPMRQVGMPEKARVSRCTGSVAKGNSRVGMPSMRYFGNSRWRSNAARNLLALGEDDDGGGDLEVQAEALLDRLVSTAHGDGSSSHLLCIEHGIQELLEPGLRDEVVGRDNVGAVPLDHVDTVATFATVANKVTALGIALIVLRSLGRSRNRVA